jgi:NitT/TauT family transport system ATP-binding protein
LAEGAVVSGRGPEPIIELHDVCMDFAKSSGAPLTVLSHIDIALKDGEILGLLGRSGSGKSTLLRIAAGLAKPTSGKATYQGRPLTGPAPGIAVVFQTFALFPWLTVLQNVEAGLDALGLPRAEASSKAKAAISLIGLDGFESAYPRELSGGMRQRVGFARAIVIDPVALLMDEPFSALDVLTAETLRTDFLDLWTSGGLPIRSVLMVTHNIEEAVLMCDRILILAANPGRIAAELPVGLPQPRNRQDPAFRSIVDEIYAALTTRPVQQANGAGIGAGLAQVLPQASIPAIAALLEAVAGPGHNGEADLSALASAGEFHSHGLLAVAEALHVLEFAELSEGRLKLTAAGRIFAQSAREQRKRLFQEHLIRFVPLAAHIQRVLLERPGGRAPRARFETELEDHLGPRDAERTLSAVVGWGRYAELFTYDDSTRSFGVSAAPPSQLPAPRKGS